MKNMGLCLYISTAWMSVVFVLVHSVLYSTMSDFIWLLYFFLRPRILNLFGGLSDAVRVSTSLPRQLTPSSRNEFVTMTSKKSLTSKMTCTILNRLRRSKKFCMLIRLQMVSQVQRNLNQVQIKQVCLVKICWGQILLRFLYLRTNLLMCPKAWKQCINTNFSLS